MHFVVQEKNILSAQRGAAMIATMVVVAAITLAVALSLSLGSLGGLVTVFGEEQSAASFFGAEACLEEAAVRLRWDSSYSGGTVGIGQATCVIGVSGSGSNRTVNATSTVATFIRKIRADLSISGGSASLNSWQEVVE